MPNPSTYFKGRFELRAPSSCIVDTSLPTFAGIVSTTPQLDGSFVVTWVAATSTKTPVRYEIYVALGSVSAAALFVTANRVAFAPGALTSWRIFVLRDQVTAFVPGQVYTFGIRALDSQNFSDTNTTILTSTALYPNYLSLAGAVWDQLEAAHTVAGSFGADVQEISADTDEIITTIGAPAGASISADIAAVKSNTAAIITTLGTPAGASISADLAEIEGETDGIAAIPTNPLLTTDPRLNDLDAPISSRVATTHFDTVIGTPAGASVSADIAQVEGHAAAADSKLGTPVTTVSGDIAQVEGHAASADSKLGTPVTTVSGDIAQVEGHAASADSKLGTPVTTVSGDIATVKSDVDAIPTTPQLASVALSQYNALISALNNIQNNTSFSGIVPEIMDIPQTGTETYAFYVGIFNSSGHPIDADSPGVTFTVKDNQGNTLQSATLMTPGGTGLYTGTFSTNSSMVDTDVVVFFNYSVATIGFQQTRTSKISTIASDSLNILAIKAKTDNLPPDPADETLVIAATTAIMDRLGAPAGASISADIAEIESETDEIAAIKAQTDQFSFAVDGVNAHTNNIPAVDVEAIADAVWDEDTASHTGSGTFGENAQTPSINPTQVAEAVWNAPISSYDETNTFGGNAQTPSINPGEVADAVWDADLSAHTGAGTFGQNAQTPSLTADEVSAAVLDAPIADHQGAGTVGAAIGVSSEPQYVNRMSTIFNNTTQLQEVLVWAEKEGQAVSGSNCTITVKDSSGATKWTQTISSPNSDGVFKFVNSITVGPDQEYYVVIAITVDGSPRTNQQPFFTIG